MAIKKKAPEDVDFPNRFAVLFDANGADKEIALSDIDTSHAREGMLLWVDLDQLRDDAVRRTAAPFGIADAAFRRLANHRRPPFLDNYGEYFTLSINLPPRPSRKTRRVAFIVGSSWLLTLHDGEPVPFFVAFRAQDKSDTHIGRLTPRILLADLLDWHLGTYFDEVSGIEERADRLDEAILKRTAAGDVMRDMLGLRREVSGLRRNLAEQRQVFYGLSRPDITIDGDDAAALEFSQLAARLDRAVDEIERTRDVLFGSFDLFTSLASQDTNALVKVLTFVTVVIGINGAVAGLLGMNFTMKVFDSGSAGFLTVVGALATLTCAAFFVARHRKWL